MAVLAESYSCAADEPDLIFRRSTVFNLLTPNDKLATYGLEQGEDMFQKRRSLLFKKMQIVRGCDTSAISRWQAIPTHTCRLQRTKNGWSSLRRSICLLRAVRLAVRDRLFDRIMATQTAGPESARPQLCRQNDRNAAARNRDPLIGVH